MMCLTASQPSEKKRILRGALLAACMSLCFATPAAAATDYFDLQPEELLNAEIVSISKRPQKASEISAAVYVISREDILRSGVTTIPDALRLAPGVQVAQIDTNSYAVSIRGFNSPLANKILVMMDGRTLYNPLYAGTYWEAQDVIMGDIDRIEIIRGPGGALWGANAVNGVINIITQSAKETQGKSVEVLAGNHERATASARQGGSFGDDDYYRAYAKFFNRGNSRHPGGGDNYDEWSSGRAGFRTDWNDESITVQGDIYRTNAHQLDNIVDFAPPFFTTQRQNIVFEGANILGRVKHDYDDGGMMTVQSYVDLTRRSQPALLEDRRGIFDVDVQYNFPAQGRHALITGGNYRLTMEDEKGSALLRMTPEQETNSIYGAFIQDRITLSPETLYLILGAKVERNHYTGIEYQPNVRLEWIPDENQTVWAAVSRAVRTPSRLERDVDLIVGAGPGTSTTLIANDNFQSEELVAYEVGYRRQISKDISIDTAAFVNVYDKLASFTLPAAPPGQVFLQLENGAKAETYGAEIAANWRVRDDWTLSGTYSMIDIFVHADTLSGFNEFASERQTPFSQATLRSFWSINDRWSLNTAAYYTGAVKADDIDPYLRLDMNLGWKVADGVQFNLVAQNLLDDAHREFGPVATPNAGEAGRSVFGKMAWQF